MEAPSSTASSSGARSYQATNAEVASASELSVSHLARVFEVLDPLREDLQELLDGWTPPKVVTCFFCVSSHVAKFQSHTS